MSHKAALHLTTATDGLAKLLPTSEAEIMRIIWACGPLKVRAIHTAIAERRAIAYTTVMTTCVRLTEKGLLRREKVQKGYGYVYSATIGEREFIIREIARYLDSIACLSHYLDTRREHAAI